MAVVIDCMQMPANCSGCMFGRPWNNNEHYCILHPMEKATTYADSRPEHCPLKYPQNTSKIQKEQSK